MKRAIINCTIALFAVLMLMFCSAPASAAQVEWERLFTDYVERLADAGEDSGVRCFMMFADLDRDGVPELLMGTNTPLDPEVRFEVLCIQDGRVVRASGSLINGAHSLKSASLTLYRTKKKKGHIWLLVTEGIEKANGVRQVRYTQIKYSAGAVSITNRFTRRGAAQWFVRGSQVPVREYTGKFKEFRANLKKLGRVPRVNLGDAKTAPSAERLKKAAAELVQSYKSFAAPQKTKITGLKKRLKRGHKLRAKLGVAPAYASVTRGTVLWSTSDPGIVSVNQKGTVKAVGYGTAMISATLPDGTASTRKITVPRPKPLKVIVSAESKTMRKGEQMPLSYRLSPSAARAKVKWTSADPAVAQVDERTGVVTAMKMGEVRISCWVNQKVKGGIAVKVTNGKLLDEIQLTAPEDALFAGDVRVLGVSLLPLDATNKDLDWSSSSPGIVSVSEAGWITARSEGTATISASALGGVRGSVRVTVAAAEHQERAPIADGVYKLSLRTGTLTVADSSIEQRAQLQIQPDSGAPNQRFLISNVGDGLLEIRPLISPNMALSTYPDPSIEDLGPQLGFISDADESARRFRATRLPGGSYAFSLASETEKSFGATSAREGADVQLMPYSESDAQRRFLLTRVGSLPATPKESAPWAGRIREYLRAHEAESASWSHIELADLDFSGAPELIIYTDTRDKSLMHSTSVRRANIFSPEGPLTASLGWFEYEPDPNTDYKDPSPKVRLLMNGNTNERSWVLTDGLAGRDVGALRYTRIRYQLGVCKSDPLIEKRWRPATNTARGLSHEQFFVDGIESTTYGYQTAYTALFDGCKWGSGSVAEIACKGRPFDQLMTELEIILASGNWYQ